MSGGYYDYAYCKLQEFAEELRLVCDNPGGKFTPEALKARLAFLTHLSKVAEAMRAVEWVEAGDFGSDAEIGPIRAVLGDHTSLNLKPACTALVKAIDAHTNGRREDACVACGTADGECPASCPLEATRAAFGSA